MSKQKLPEKKASRKKAFKPKWVVEVKWSFKLPAGVGIDAGVNGLRLSLTLGQAKELLEYLQEHIPEIEKSEKSERMSDVQNTKPQ